MRSYGQYCAIARALDVVGDRWNLLIVRELELRGPCRYTDLQAGLPGIATNLLADRLRDLEGAGVIRRDEAPAPVAASLFSLTERGRALKPVLVELLRWGAPLMTVAEGDEAFCSHWLTAPVELFLADRTPADPPVSIELRANQEPPMTIETIDGELRTRAGASEHPTLVLSGSPQALLGVLAGELELSQAEEQGLRYSGDRRALDRLQPV